MNSRIRRAICVCTIPAGLLTACIAICLIYGSNVRNELKQQDKVKEILQERADEIQQIDNQCEELKRSIQKLDEIFASRIPYGKILQRLISSKPSNAELVGLETHSDGPADVGRYELQLTYHCKPRSERTQIERDYCDQSNILNRNLIKAFDCKLGNATADQKTHIPGTLFYPPAFGEFIPVLKNSKVIEDGTEKDKYFFVYEVTLWFELQKSSDIDKVGHE